MAPDTAGPSRFKSRFSLLSLLPARHPPLQISAPRPIPPTQQVPFRQPTVISLADSAISPVHSEYPDTAYSTLTPSPVPPLPPLPPAPPHRPPPLDLTRTKEMYPGVVGCIPTAGTLHPPIKPSSEKKEKKQRTRQDDPFEAVEIEPKYKYTSWKGGRVSIKPGQLIPQNTNNRTPTIRGKNPDALPLRSNREISQLEPEQYESVLHNVLLTPTYIASSPAVPPTPSPLSSGGSWPNGSNKRKTLLNAMKRGSKWIARGGKPSEADRAIQDMRQREQQEMAKFRSANRPVRIASRDPVIHVYQHGSSGSTNQLRSPASREWNVGVKWAASDTKSQYAGHDGGWRKHKQAEANINKKKRIWKIAIVLAILCLAALTIGLCTTLLTNSSKQDDQSTSTSSSSDTSDTAASSTDDSTPSASPSATSRTLATCLDLFSKSASSSPLTYPCSDCVPLLTSTTNDYTQDIVNGNSTNVGAALQFCSLMDIYKASHAAGLQKGGWMKDGSPCGWDGIQCDDRGRIKQLEIKYPDVPDKLHTTLGNLVSLQTFRLMGNTTVPTGAFPSSLLKLGNLTTLDIEYTALTGPLSEIDVGQAKKLETLYLVNNPQLGTSLPNLEGNDQLKTLAVTGQGLTKIMESDLPSSLTYLDLSYNDLSDSVPAFSNLKSLQTLYLTNNKFTSGPSSFPAALTQLSLTANPSLEGFMPADFCLSAAVTSCDLRSTKLLGPNLTPVAISGVNSPSQSASSVITSSSPFPTSTTGGVITTAKACGVCKFD